jgi:hypothetical protein
LQRFEFRLVVDQAVYDRFRYAQELLGPRVPAGDLAEVFGQAIEALIAKLERRKFAATDRPRPGPSRAPANPRTVPAQVQRAVWERDGGQCTFVSESGQRCPARTRLEFDHVVPVACGGPSTVENVRLLCAGHNQHAAQCAFGAGFMEDRRRAAAEARAKAAADREAKEREAKEREAKEREAKEREAKEREAREREKKLDVVPWLRALGYRATDARRAAECCAGLPDTSLEERVRVALRYLAPPHRKVAFPASAGHMGNGA